MNLCKSLLFLGLTTLSFNVLALDKLIGIVGKRVDDVNFVDVVRGCNEKAKQYGDSCILIGPTGTSHPRAQAHAITQAIQSKHFDALAISVTDSELIGHLLVDAVIPIFTFDSAFSGEYRALSRSHIGVIDHSFGEELAKAASLLQPGKGEVCFMSGRYDTNLTDRLTGARTYFSSKNEHLKKERLDGDNGWIESARCPWNSSDDVIKTSRQVKKTLTEIQPDVFLSVGHWPIVDIDQYRETVLSHRYELKHKKIVIVVGTGKVSDDIQALLDERLLHAVVSIDFYEIGSSTYDVINKMFNNEDYGKYIVKETFLKTYFCCDKKS